MSWASLDHLFTEYILHTSFVTWSDEQTHHKLFNIGRFLSFHVILGFHSFGELLYFGIATWMIFLVAYQLFFFPLAFYSVNHLWCRPRKNFGVAPLPATLTTRMTAYIFRCGDPELKRELW